MQESYCFFIVCNFAHHCFYGEAVRCRQGAWSHIVTLIATLACFVVGLSVSNGEELE